NRAAAEGIYQTNGYGGFFEYTGDLVKDGNTSNQFSVTDLPDSCGGILWIRGPLSGIGRVAFKGLIFVEGEMTVSNQIWVLGALMVRGNTTLYDEVTNNAPGAGRGMHMRGNGDLLYSSEVLQYVMQQISSTTNGLKQISWREIDIQ
ncbi:MAG: hypothetical protein Q8O74_02680, partial [bacterium]|nr:hypothetical protein [bacterium]